ncbi:carbon-nitrogen hydrolase family protein [Sulfurimonas sp. SAG-AH-194-I05]|nr:carbon-nitrogen hydrolase family protein [Sulfurimonas sp. SAG-AH-194-I05]MDF1875721.1 carbon-nitrogen hydrolase family protein [Sulfurimonas sp. SAG-AH-194-I05]
MRNYTLHSLLFKTTSDYEANLVALLELLQHTPEQSLVVAPEVCLTGFDYENFDKAADFTQYALSRIKKLSFQKIIILTMIEKSEGAFYNRVKVIHNGEVIHERAKARLFHFGGEHEYFSEGEDSHVEIIEVEGIKIAILVCFELRFKELWKLCEGADVIATPSWWGVLRAEHFKALTQTLAIMNQCYVVASDSMNDTCSKMSGIINPKGEALYNGNTPCLEVVYSKKEISLMRRYIDVGIGNERWIE